LINSTLIYILICRLYTSNLFYFICNVIRLSIYVERLLRYVSWNFILLKRSSFFFRSLVYCNFVLSNCKFSSIWIIYGIYRICVLYFSRRIVLFYFNFFGQSISRNLLFWRIRIIWIILCWLFIGWNICFFWDKYFFFWLIYFVLNFYFIFFIVSLKVYISIYIFINASDIRGICLFLLIILIHSIPKSKIKFWFNL
jgi:hypothetical protein